jgi:hypothetical protein
VNKDNAIMKDDDEVLVQVIEAEHSISYSDLKKQEGWFDLNLAVDHSTHSASGSGNCIDTMSRFGSCVRCIGYAFQSRWWCRYMVTGEANSLPNLREDNERLWITKNSN